MSCILIFLQADIPCHYSLYFTTADTVLPHVLYLTHITAKHESSCMLLNIELILICTVQVNKYSNSGSIPRNGFLVVHPIRGLSQYYKLR